MPAARGRAQRGGRTFRVAAGLREGLAVGQQRGPGHRHAEHAPVLARLILKEEQAVRTGFPGDPCPHPAGPRQPAVRPPSEAPQPTSMYAVSLFASLMCGNQSRGGLDRCLDSVTNHSSFGHPWGRDKARSGERHPEGRCGPPLPAARGPATAVSGPPHGIHSTMSPAAPGHTAGAR